MPYEINSQTETSTRFQCRHIFTDGHRCGSPALRNENFCFYHHTSRRPVQDGPTRSRRKARFTLPNPEDRSAIQASLGEVLRRLAANELDPRRAGLILYGLQIASLNLGKHIPAEPDTTVESITLDPTHGPIAPEAELELPKSKRPSTLSLLLQRIDKDFPRTSKAGQTEQDSSSTLPTIQAVASHPKSAPNTCRSKTLRRKVPLPSKTRDNSATPRSNTPQTVPVQTRWRITP